MNFSGKINHLTATYYFNCIKILRNFNRTNNSQQQILSPSACLTLGKAVLSPISTLKDGSKLNGWEKSG